MTNGNQHGPPSIGIVRYSILHTVVASGEMATVTVPMVGKVITSPVRQVVVLGNDPRPVFQTESGTVYVPLGV